MRIKLFTVLVMLCAILPLAAGCKDKSTEYFEVTSSEEVGSSAEKDTATCFVFVCGEVNKPGVYELPVKSRYKDAIEMAGGLTGNADITAVNQASVVKDQDKIVVPSKTGAEQGSGTGLISLNQSTKEQLMTLPGIGEAKATSIIAYRDKKGGFKSVEELLKVEGIKAGVFNKIKDSISV